MRRTIAIAISFALSSLLPALTDSHAATKAQNGPSQAQQGPAVPDQEAAQFYFYSPDWRPGNLSLLQESFERVIALEGLNVRFQAFAYYQDFLERVQIDPPEFVVLPSWLDRSDDFGFQLDLIARPLRHGKTGYRKALMAKPALRSIEDLSRGTIAATVHAMGPRGDRTVLEIFNLNGSTMNVVAVPKDVDALLALSFGQVDAALVTSAQFETLTRENPNIIRDLQVLAVSPEIEFPGVYAVVGADRELRQRIVDALGRLGDHRTGKHLLDLLGYEALIHGNAPLQRAALNAPREGATSR